MYPVLFKFGPLTVHTYGFLVALGFLIGLSFAVIQAKKEGVSSEKIIDLSFYLLLSAIIGSRLFFVFINFDHYLSKPLDIFKIWEGGLVFYGGVLLAIPTVLWYVKKHSLPFWSTADIFTPSIAIGHSFGRLGCFAAGCCYGKTAELLPWGVIFTDPECLAPTRLPLHPTQLYESAGEFVNFLVLLGLRRHKSFNGQLFMTYLLLYSVLRFTVEFFRGDISRGFIYSQLSVSQGISILLFLGGIAGFIILKHRNRRVTGNSP
ncbi:MAG: prolipoprotein diacylglyceryl transferase [Nitrospirota bacterium]